jgi:protein required for attachment to host cells
MVLVADGRKMLFFRNRGDSFALNLEAETVKVQDNPSNRDQASDAPGRSVNSVGSHRSSMEQTNFHDLEESRFAAEAVALLNRRALAQDYEKLIVIAPPTALGEMR